MNFNRVISRLKKLILKSIENCWSKINPIMFVHSSDLMLPGNAELTGIQLIVISRLKDIECRNAGGVIIGTLE